MNLTEFQLQEINIYKEISKRGMGLRWFYCFRLGIDNRNDCSWSCQRWEHAAELALNAGSDMDMESTCM